jgi:hypothetical protein
MTIRPLSPFLQKLIAHAVNKADDLPQAAPANPDQSGTTSPADPAKLLDHRA